MQLGTSSSLQQFNVIQFYFSNRSLHNPTSTAKKWTKQCLKEFKKLGCSGGQVVNMLAFYSDDPSLNPTEVPECTVFTFYSVRGPFFKEFKESNST